MKIIYSAAILSKEKSSLKCYFNSFLKWKRFAIEHGLAILPACNKDICLFLLNLAEKDVSWPTLKMILSSISFFHRVFGFDQVVLSNTYSLVKEFVMKVARKPSLKREPILVEHLKKIFALFDFQKCSLFHLRNVGVLIVGFFGFLRVFRLPGGLGDF